MPCRVVSLLVALATATCAGGASAERDTERRVVVFPVGGELDASDRRLFDAMLRSELRHKETLEVVTDDVRQVHVEAVRTLGIACPPGEALGVACVTEVGRLAGARWALYGVASTGRAVELTLVDTVPGEAVGHATASLPPTGESLSPALRSLVNDLVAKGLGGQAAAARAAPASAPPEDQPVPTAPDGTPAAAPNLWLLGGIGTLAAGALVGTAGTLAGLWGAAAAVDRLPVGTTAKDRDAALETSRLFGGLTAGSALAGGLVVAAGVGLVVTSLFVQAE